jgi:dienelactone hydrolase
MATRKPTPVRRTTPAAKPGPQRARVADGPVAPERPAHGYYITQPVPGSPYPVDLTFVFTRDEIYLPVAVRKPPGGGPFPAIIMGRGAGRDGLPHVIEQIQRLTAMQDRMIERGYAVVYVNYRNEIPQLYGQTPRAENVADTMSGGENRTLKSAPTLDSDDLVAVVRYLRTVKFVDGDAIGAVGVSHSGEMILKAAAETTFAAGVVIEGASHEFLQVNTGRTAPRKGHELQYQNIRIVRKNADKKKAMERIRRIETPLLHIGREGDHLAGIFRLAHEWMEEAGKDTTWASFEHPEHGYPFIYADGGGAFRPDPVQQQAFDLFMAFFDRHLQRTR